MEQRETAREIEDAAAAWVARIDRAPLSSSAQAQLDAWLAGDPRRRGAFLRSRALWMKAGQENPERAHLHLVPAAAPPRRTRNPLRWWGTAAASVLLAVLVVTTTRMPTAYATALGEMRLVPLGDGSSITLNTDTRVQVFEQDGRPRVRLVQGEAFFQVARHGATPFVVEVGDARIETAGAGFLVRRLPGRSAEVLAQGGELLLHADAGARPLRLGANAGLALAEARPAASRPAPLSDKDLQRELAWREGKIAFEGETLAEAATAFARYSKMHIVIDDPQLAKEPVSGLFATNNPVGFSRAVAEVFDARLRQEPDRIVLSRSH